MDLNISKLSKKASQALTNYVEEEKKHHDHWEHMHVLSDSLRAVADRVDNMYDSLSVVEHRKKLPIELANTFILVDQLLNHFAINEIEWPNKIIELLEELKNNKTEIVELDLSSLM